MCYDLQASRAHKKEHSSGPHLDDVFSECGECFVPPDQVSVVLIIFQCHPLRAQSLKVSLGTLHEIDRKEVALKGSAIDKSVKLLSEERSSFVTILFLTI